MLVFFYLKFGMIEMIIYKDAKGEERYFVILVVKFGCWGWDYICFKEKSCYIMDEWEVKFVKFVINLLIYI